MLSPNMRGSLYMVVAMAAFTFNDAFVKLLSDDLAVVFIIFLRGIITTVVIGLIVYVNTKITSLEGLKHPLNWVRALMDVGATFTFLIALKHMPFANAAAILSALPLAVTIGSALFLKEPVGWRRWLAIVIGFFGVLLIVRPGLEGFNSYSIYVMISVVFAAGRDLATRRAPSNIPSMVLTLLTSIAITVAGAIAVFLTDTFTPVDMSQGTGIVAAASFLICAYYFIIAAMRVGEISFVAPFRYTNLIWAILIGLFVFNDTPDLLTMIGTAVIVATGIYTLYREQLRKH